jgi:hypothetical protein
MRSYIVDVSEAREDWSEVLAHLEAARAIEQRAGAAAVARTLEQIARWTGETARG